MKKTIFAVLMITSIFFYSKNSFAALFCLGNKPLPAEKQGLEGLDFGQGSGQSQNLYGDPTQSTNPDSDGTSGSGGGGSGGGDGSSGTQYAQVDTPEEENPGDNGNGGNNNGGTPPSGGLPVTIGGIFPEDYDPTAGGNTTGTNPPSGGLPVTIGGIFPEDYDPITGDDDDFGGVNEVDGPPIPAAHAPEPSTIALLASGLAGIGMRIRRRKK